jgi:hypothetical protein
VTSDLWPSMSNVLAAPFMRAAGRTPTGDVRGIRQQSSLSEQNVAVRIAPSNLITSMSKC